MSRAQGRRLPIGTEVQTDGSADFRVWAPEAKELSVQITRCGRARDPVSLEPDRHGYFSARVDDVRAGDTYRYRFNGEELADPVSRFQPEGPFGPSQVVDPGAFRWTDREWPGVTIPGQVIYELHVGTFTREGTWRAGRDRLPMLADMGITVLEVMPVSDFPGRFGWGYDGVFPYAPTRLYGEPDDFRAFVDRAHALGLAVILDVVYNHLGPDGCVFRRYAPQYFTKAYDNEWGDALNFDGEGAAAVREYFASNAAYWIAEYHLDGLRLDATQSIHDRSHEHIIAAIAKAARAAAGGRQIALISENEPQHVRMVRPVEEGGYGLDALWNDDFHHSAVVALTGRREAYYFDHQGTPQELISAAKYGYLFQGQRYAWQKQRRGTSSRGIRPSAFVNFIENHDQLANTGDGARLHTRAAPGQYRAMTAVLLLFPGTPMLFQGQEFGASTPFLYFADHNPTLAAAVQKGRAEFVAQFPSLARPEIQSRLAEPHDVATFERCKLRWEEYDRHEAARKLHRDLLMIRRRHPAFLSQEAGAVDGAILGDHAFVLRYGAPRPLDERLLVVNFGSDLDRGSFAEPLLAPPEQCRWSVCWSSEHPDYGGMGSADVETADGWHIPGFAAVVLQPEQSNDADGRR